MGSTYDPDVLAIVQGRNNPKRKKKKGIMHGLNLTQVVMAAVELVSHFGSLIPRLQEHSQVKGTPHMIQHGAGADAAMIWGTLSG